MIKLFFTITILAFLSTLTGKVVKVSDGDTITILTEDKRQIKVRLEGIDCPESKQDFGNRAKQATSKLCAGKIVRIEKSGVDRYGRVIGFVYVDEINVNKELLKMGLAWHYKYFNQNKELAELEAKARENKIGLWSNKKSIAPWEFRRK